MKISEKWLLAAACLFAGVILGFLLAPIKKGIYCGNYSGNRYGNLPADGCWTEDDQDGEEV